MRRKAKKKTRKTLAQTGRKIVAAKKQNLRGENVLEGVMPRRGLWLVCNTTRRVYSRILQVRSNGTIVATGSFGKKIEHNPSQLYGNGYAYVETMPEGEGWTYLVDLQWVGTPPVDWPKVRKPKRRGWAVLGRKAPGDWPRLT